MAAELLKKEFHPKLQLSIPLSSPNSEVIPPESSFNGILPCRMLQTLQRIKCTANDATGEFAEQLQASQNLQHFFSIEQTAKIWAPCSLLASFGS
jgi:hypothetical protein